MRLILGLGLLTSLALGCNDDYADPTDADGGGADAGGRDSGGIDAGGIDAGADDAASSDDGGTTDAGGDDCPDLAPTEPAAVVISQIDLATRRVELFNPRSEAVTFTTHQWCQRPAYARIATTGPETIGPGSYAVYTLPEAFPIAASAASGELAVYADASYSSTGSIIDFVCWGAPPALSRVETAELAGIWSPDGCTPAPSFGAVVRRPRTAGDDASSYDTTAAFAATICN